MTGKEKIETMAKICERAEKMGIADPRDARWERIIDLEYTDREFHLRLEEFLNADDMDFVHDFCGIQRNFDRRTCKMGNLFVPRFAGYDSKE